MKTRIISIITIIALAGLCGCSQGNAATKAAEFTLLDINGRSVSLSDFKGKVIILDFWATWCPPCKAEIPHFIELYYKYKSKGLEIIGIGLDTGGAKVLKEFANANGVTYPILVGNNNVTNAYGGVRGIPTTFVIDREGNIIKKLVGYQTKEVFEELIQDLL